MHKFVAACTLPLRYCCLYFAMLPVLRYAACTLPLRYCCLYFAIAACTSLLLPVLRYAACTLPLRYCCLYFAIAACTSLCCLYFAIAACTSLCCLYSTSSLFKFLTLPDVAFCPSLIHMKCFAFSERCPVHHLFWTVSTKQCTSTCRTEAVVCVAINLNL